MDVVWTLQYLLSAPQFGGCIEENQEEEYDALRWEDERPKPSWAEIVAAWPAAQKTMVPLLVRLDNLFDNIPPSAAPVGARVYFRSLQGVVRRCLSAAVPDVEAALFVIQTATMPGDTYTEGYTLPAELAGFQQALLAEFN